MNDMLRQWGMSNDLPCLRRTEPSAALIPHPGQSRLVYVPAARSDIRKRIHEFNRRRMVTLEASLARGFVVRSHLDGGNPPLEIADVPA